MLAYFVVQFLKCCAIAIENLVSFKLKNDQYRSFKPSNEY